jgi:hypothetical protein
MGGMVYRSRMKTKAQPSHGRRRMSAQHSALGDDDSLSEANSSDSESVSSMSGSR